MRIFYGIDSPDSFHTGTGGPTLDEVVITPDSSNDVRLEGVYETSVTEEESIQWVDLMQNHGLSKSAHAKYLKEDPRGEDQLSPLWKEFRECCNDESMEKRFFNLYTQMTAKGAFGGGYSGFSPALIPNVTVNWNPESREEKEPCHVDFLIKHEKIEDGVPTVIELDGIQHFGEKRGDGVWEASPQRYADTLRKSRFLRRLGFRVVRISNSQLRTPLIEGVENESKGFYEFWKRTFESEAFIDRYEDVGPPPSSDRGR